MKKKSYGIATPSFISSTKQYQLKALVHNLKTKMYGIRLNAMTPFLGNEKEYPVKLPPSSRLPGIVDEEVSEVGERIKTVDTVLTGFANGLTRRNEKGAIINKLQHSSRKDERLSSIAEYFNLSRIDTFEAKVVSASRFTDHELGYIIEILESQPVYVRDEWAIDIIKDYMSIRGKEVTVKLNEVQSAALGIDEIDVSFLDNEQAMKIVRVLLGKGFENYAQGEVIRQAQELKYLELEASSIIRELLDSVIEEFSEFDDNVIPSVLPELITAYRNETIPVVFNEYDLADSAFYPILTPLLEELEFYYRVQDNHPESRLFNDYDYGVHNMTYESNGFLQHFDLANRFIDTFDVRYLDYNFGMRNKYLTPVNEGRFDPLLERFDRHYWERDVRYLEYDLGIKPTVDNVDFLYPYDLAFRVQEKDAMGTIDDGFSGANHNMLFVSASDDGFDLFNHNMQYESQFYEEFDFSIQAINEAGFYEFFDFATREKELEGKFAEFYGFAGAEFLTYLPEFDMAFRVIKQPDVVFQDGLPVNRAALIENVNITDLSWFNRIDEWEGLTSSLSESYRLNTFASEYDETEPILRINTFVTSIDSLYDLDRVNTFTTLIDETTHTYRSDIFDSVVNSHVVSQRADAWDTTLSSFELVDRHTDYITRIHDTVDTYDTVPNMIDIIDLFTTNERNMIYEGIRDDMTGGEIAYIPVDLIEYDLGEINHEYVTNIGDIDFGDKLNDHVATIPDFDIADRYAEYTAFEQLIFDASKSREYRTIIELIEGADKYRDAPAEIIETWYVDGHRDQLAVIGDIDWFEKRFHIADMDDGLALADIDNEALITIEDIDWFTRSVLEMGSIIETELFTREVEELVELHEFDLFGRTVLIMGSLEEIHWFGKTVEPAVIDDIDWYTRTEKYGSIVDDTFGIRDMMYEGSEPETFDDFWGPPNDEYTWLWHSKPYSWYTWNWYKTK